MKFGFLSNNMLKVIACITMLIDHMGVILFPNIMILRIIGRVSFPIFAFLLAEGCFYTRNKLRHFLVISGFALVMQVVLYFATSMTDFSIFVHFSIAVGICYIIDFIDKFFREKKYMVSISLIIGLILLSCFIFIIDNSTMYFYSNYGIYGIFLPVSMYIVRKYIKDIHIFINIALICIALVLMNHFRAYNYQLYGMFSFVFILLYNGKKGKYNLKYLFYIFYPLHMVILYAIAMLI